MSTYGSRKGLAKQQQTPIASGKSITTHETLYRGIIPPPDMMEHFAEIDPTLPGRIIGMAEDEGKERRIREKSIIDKSFALDMVSTILGFFSVLGVVWLCYQFVLKGFAKEGSYVALGVLVSLAVVFVLRRKPPRTKT